MATGLLTQDELRTLEAELQKYNEVSALYDPKIEEIVKQLEAIIKEIEEIPGLMSDLNTKLDEATSKKEKDAITKKQQALSDKLNVGPGIIKDLKADIKKLEAAKMDAIIDVDPNNKEKPGFFFNQIIANKVPAGSYYLVDDSNIEGICRR